MRKVDRGNYSANQFEAYNDNPHSIGIFFFNFLSF